MIRDQRDSAMVMKMIEFVHDHGPRWIIAIVRKLSILSLKGSWILHFPFGLICTYVVWDSSAIWQLFVRLAGAMGRQSALHKENSGFATPTLGRHISTFRGYQILFSIRNQGSRWRAIRAKKSPCGCSLRFVLVSKEKWKSPCNFTKSLC